MGALSVRLEKAAARIPPPPVLDTNPRPQVDFRVICERISAETARVAVLPPAERLAHILDAIEKVRRKAAAPMPPSDGSVRASLAETFRKVAVMDAKKGFPNVQWEKRRCEIQILRENGYDVAELDRVHRAMAHLPWQWIHYQTDLPPAAQAIIDLELFAL